MAQIDRATLQAALVGYQQQLDEIHTKMTELRRRQGANRSRAARTLGQIQKEEG